MRDVDSFYATGDTTTTYGSTTTTTGITTTTGATTTTGEGTTTGSTTTTTLQQYWLTTINATTTTGLQQLLVPLQLTAYGILITPLLELQQLTAMILQQ